MNCVIREVPYEGEVGAGRLLPFVPKEGTVTFPVPDDIPESEPLGIMKVNGVSLKGVGIDNGDMVLVRKVFNRKQITRNTICILYLRHLGEVVAKKVSFEKGHVVLHYCGINPEPPMYCPPSDVDFRGIVVSASRHQTEWPFVGNAEPVEIGVPPAERKKRLAELVKRFTKKEEEKELPF